MSPSGIIGSATAGAIAVVIVAIILTTTTWDVPKVETYYVSQPYTYTQSLVRLLQVRNFPWINESTQAQYIVENTFNESGTFLMNYLFDNGNATETKNTKVNILAGEKKTVTMDSTLRGKSTVIFNVVPPEKYVQKTRTVMRKVSGWDYFFTLKFLFK